MNHPHLNNIDINNNRYDSPTTPVYQVETDITYLSLMTRDARYSRVFAFDKELRKVS